MVKTGLLNATVPFEFSQVAEYEEKYDLYDLHEQLLNILTEFDRLCRENDIHYSLADGTLLGAMRHADFIPWDDDADVMMTKEEYLKLKSVISRQQTVRMCKICFLDRITIRGMEEKGLYIDLFINEDMPASKIVFAWKKFKTRFLRTYFIGIEPMNVRHEGDSKIKKRIHNMLGKFGRKLIIIAAGGAHRRF